jgi:predicted O-methyltransferase YrrM
MGGSLEKREIEPYLEKFPDLIRAIELGTYKGYSSRVFSTLFEEVYTFEISETLHNEAVNTAKECNLDTSGYLLGDSVCLLKQLLTEEPNKPSFIYADSHLSGSDSSYNMKEFVPLLSELKVINEHYPINQKGVIVVDDVRLFDRVEGTKYHDWAHVSFDSIKACLTNHIITHEVVENDRYWLTIN